MMQELHKARPETRYVKLKSRLTREGPGPVLSWTAQWIYWNAGIFRAFPPSTFDNLRNAYKFRRRNKKYGIRDPIIVYQMAKVGSTSVYRSLLALDLDVPVYHIHFLNYLDEIETWIRQTFGQESKVQEIIREGRQLRRAMERAPHRRWNLVSLVRAPIPRTISTYFQNLDANFPDYYQRASRNELTACELADYFVNHYVNDTYVTWFDQQVKELFGIDVYASEFPKSRGYQIYEKDKIRLMVIRLEDLNRCASEAFYEFLDVPDFKLATKNVTEQGEFAQFYGTFREVLRLPPERVQQAHKSRYAQHFYTDEELAFSVRAWT